MQKRGKSTQNAFVNTVKTSLMSNPPFLPQKLSESIYHSARISHNTGHDGDFPICDRSTCVHVRLHDHNVWMPVVLQNVEPIGSTFYVH